MVGVRLQPSQESARHFGHRRAQPRPLRAVQSEVQHLTSVLGRLLCLIALAACGASQSQPTTPQREVVEMEELRITAARGAEGYRFEVYDAADLFKKATELLNQQKCREAVELYTSLAHRLLV